MAEQMLGLDPLSGLPNRRYLLRELERHIELYKRYRHPFTLLLLHFDNLSGVRDSSDDSGDAAGEAALAYLATLIQTHVRATDICGLLSEGEFAVIMPETNRRAGETLGWRITESVVPRTFQAGDTSISVKVSVGTASCPRDGVEVEALLQAARTHKATWG